MEYKIENIRPMMDRRNDNVVAWLFRITITEGVYSIFGDIFVPLLEAGEFVDRNTGMTVNLDAMRVRLGLLRLQRPLASWTQQEVNELVKIATAIHPEVQILLDKLLREMNFYEKTNFSLIQLKLE